MISVGVAQIPRALLSSAEGYTDAEAAIGATSVVGLLGGKSAAGGSSFHFFEYLVVYIPHPAGTGRSTHEPNDAASVNIEDGNRVSVEEGQRRSI